MHRLLCELRPRYLVVENTEGLFARGLGRVLGDLAEAGYDAEWSCLSARDFGAPHERERVFLVAYPDQEHGATRLGDLAHRTRPVFAGDDAKRVSFWLQAPSEAVGMADGVSGRIYKDRAGAIGNAIVPQIAEFIARQILEAERVTA